jgi:hypothetical protein
MNTAAEMLVWEKRHSSCRTPLYRVQCHITKHIGQNNLSHTASGVERLHLAETRLPGLATKNLQKARDRQNMIKGKQQLGSMATSKRGPLLTAHLVAFQLMSRFPKDKDQGALGGKLLHQHL